MVRQDTWIHTSNQQRPIVLLGEVERNCECLSRGSVKNQRLTLLSSERIPAQSLLWK